MALGIVVLVKAVVVHAAPGPGIGDGEPSLSAADQAAEALSPAVDVAQRVCPQNFAPLL
jgi:hypothetical protein